MSVPYVHKYISMYSGASYVGRIAYIHSRIRTRDTRLPKQINCLSRLSLYDVCLVSVTVKEPPHALLSLGASLMVEKWEDGQKYKCE